MCNLSAQYSQAPYVVNAEKHSFIFAGLFRAGSWYSRGEPYNSDTEYPAADKCLDAEIDMYIPTTVF